MFGPENVWGYAKTQVRRMKKQVIWDGDVGVGVGLARENGVEFGVEHEVAHNSIEWLGMFRKSNALNGGSFSRDGTRSITHYNSVLIKCLF